MELNRQAKLGLTGRKNLTSWVSSTSEWSGIRLMHYFYARSESLADIYFFGAEISSKIRKN